MDIMDLGELFLPDGLSDEELEEELGVWPWPRPTPHCYPSDYY